MRRPPPPSECAQCGAEIPRNALACPECGADERTGWRESSIYDGMELPDDAWDDEHVAAKPSRVPDRRVNGLAWYWWAVGVALLLLIGLSFLGLR